MVEDRLYGLALLHVHRDVFYLLKCAKRIRHKLNKLMKSSPIYNKLQQQRSNKYTNQTLKPYLKCLCHYIIYIKVSKVIYKCRAPILRLYGLALLHVHRDVFYLLKCAKRIRHKLSKLMKSSPIFSKYFCGIIFQFSLLFFNNLNIHFICTY
jgi:hypothetical protein